MKNEKKMEKVEILKLQADAYAKPHIMWRVEVEKDIIKYPMDLIKEVSPWEWCDDVEHDAMVGSLLTIQRMNDLEEEIVDCMLLNANEYDDISDEDYSTLRLYVGSKIEEVILDDAFDEEVAKHFAMQYKQWDVRVAELLK